MPDTIDFLNQYVMGSIQMLTGAYFLTRFLQKKMKLHFYVLFAVLCIMAVRAIPGGSMMEFAAYMLLLMTAGIFACHSDWKSVMLYAALAVGIMQLCYGIVNSLSGILFPLAFPFHHRLAGIAFMLSGNAVSLLLTVLCYRMVSRYFLYPETVEKQYLLMILTPVLMLFLMDEYISSSMYGSIVMVSDGTAATPARHFQMLFIQLLGITSLFCILTAYKKLLHNFRLRRELSLLEQNERSLTRRFMACIVL